jgi:hypothetical protein
MLALRWILGLTAAIGIVFWVLLLIVAQDFRRSFGASDISAIRAFSLPVILLFVVATVILPDHRLLLHVAAAIMLIGIITSVLILRESLFVGSAGLIFLGAWFLFYRLVIWSSPR